MQTKTFTLKAITAAVWLAVILNQFVTFPDGLKTFLDVTGIFLIVAHTLECIFFSKKIIEGHKSALKGFVQVFLFGIIHLRALPNFKQ